MVDFALSEEERMIRDLAHEFAAKEIRPVAEYYDEHEGEYPTPVVKKAHELGLGGGAFGGARNHAIFFVLNKLGGSTSPPSAAGEISPKFLP